MSEARDTGGSGLLTDTIVAQATPAGIGAVAVVRLSGPEAVPIVSRLSGGECPSWSPRRATLVRLQDPGSGQVLDQALVTVFPGPDSYTGEDVVEVSTHGGYLIPRQVMEACIGLGARPARAGEFTQRAFLHGKVDLTQAEAVTDLITASAPKAAEVALHQLARGLSDQVGALREELIGLEALLVQHVDFPDEDEAPVPLERISERARRLEERIARLAETAPAGELLRDGVLTVLAGPPNSGKSSLFNALLGRERAIVTDEAGTTRDAIEATISVGGYPFRLVDTAGLRSSGAGRVESLGIEVAERYLSQADLVLYCRPLGQRLTADEERFIASRPGPALLVRTMSDLDPAGGGLEGGSGDVPVVTVSARTGDGLKELGETALGLVFRGLVENRGDVPVITNRRQRGLLERARTEVAGFSSALDRGVPAEAAGAHLKAAATALEETVGLVTTDEILDVVFREFCIGK